MKALMPVQKKCQLDQVKSVSLLLMLQSLDDIWCLGKEIKMDKGYMFFCGEEKDREGKVGKY